MKLESYLARIGFEGDIAPDRACLQALHRQHLLSISYEALDVQLGRPVDRDIERIFDKIVVRRRGGWCYEMNGLFDWALREIGFDVMRMSGGVMRSIDGDKAFGNHLVLAVRMANEDSEIIADVGLGDGILDVIPLREGTIDQGERRYRLERLDGDLWRFHNHTGALPPDFDFVHEPADEDELDRTCQTLQTDPDSLFRQNLLCMKRNRDHSSDLLIGRVLTRSGSERHVLEDVDAFCAALKEVFGVDDPEFRDLWPQVCARHEELFGAD